MTNSAKVDAVALLKADHRKVEGLGEKFHAAKSSGRKALAEEICAELTSLPRLRKTSFIQPAKAKSMTIYGMKPMSSMTVPKS
jgi:hypothetical protein